MVDVTDEVRELARVFGRSGRPVLQVVFQRGFMSFRIFDRAGGRVRAGGAGAALTTSLRGLDKALRPAGEVRPLVVELRLDDRGRHEFRHTFDLLSVSPAQVVLDSGYRHPHHPRHGMPAPSGAEVVDRPTDPAVLATVRGLVDEYVGLYTAIKGRAPDFGAGYSEEDLLAAETAIGLRLPEDVRALYRTVHDDMAERGLLGAQALLSLATVVSEYLELVPGSYGWSDDLFVVDPVVFEAHPAGLVRRMSRSDWWVTIATDVSGDWCAVDLDPAPGGTPGQLIVYGRNVIGPVGYIAESVTAVLREVVAALRAGSYVDEEPEYARLWSVDRIGAAASSPYHQVLELNGRSLPSVVAELASPLDVQQLSLNDGGDLDLADLAPLKNLRDVSVNRAAAATLAVPHDLPIEALSVEAAAIDLAPITAHPTLWKLTLKGVAGPIAVEPLTTLPALAHLDLSAVEVTDLELVARMPRIRVLVLSQGQWQHLRTHDAVPPSLAAAELAGHTSLEAATTWATWLRTRPGE